LASYSGLVISIYPYMVPPSITIWQAAAPDESLLLLLVGAVVLLHITIGESAYGY
jgi:cytochrome d ubiquinol oxidase subunit II